MMPRFRLMAVIMMALTALALAVGTADARVGGGSSFGSRGGRTFAPPPVTRTAPNRAAPIQRSITQPNRPTFGQPATRPFGGGFFGRPGFLGGLFAGFLGAGLFGMLFGHGLFGGLGGIGSIFGLLLQIALIVIVGRLIWGWWQRRNMPAYAGPSGRPDGYARDAYNGLGGQATGGFGAAGQDITIGPDDYSAFEKRLQDIQLAYGREDLNALNMLVTPEMLSYFSEDLSDNASRGVVNRISDVKLLQGDLSEAWREGTTEYASVAMTFSLVDQTVDRRSGQVVEGDASPITVTELWTFRRSSGGQWLLSAIQQT
jgi:predicted lipid-binding transport protein (Tim44 family)